MMEHNKYSAYHCNNHNYMAITTHQPHFTMVKWYSGNVVTLYRAKAPRLGKCQHRASVTSQRTEALIWAWELELELGAA